MRACAASCPLKHCEAACCSRSLEPWSSDPGLFKAFRTEVNIPARQIAQKYFADRARQAQFCTAVKPEADQKSRRSTMEARQGPIIGVVVIS